ncbi:MAG: hypothetical protein QOI13_2185 [Paraburkholderia sp.]|nr:hypothetical protein [Paraburkholderia sp.]
MSSVFAKKSLECGIRCTRIFASPNSDQLANRVVRWRLIRRQYGLGRTRSIIRKDGKVAEWSNAPDSKSGVRLYRTVGSNPTLSAKISIKTGLSARFSFLPPKEPPITRGTLDQRVARHWEVIVTVTGTQATQAQATQAVTLLLPSRSCLHRPFDSPRRRSHESAQEPAARGAAQTPAEPASGP